MGKEFTDLEKLLLTKNDLVQQREILQARIKIVDEQLIKHLNENEPEISPQINIKEEKKSDKDTEGKKEAKTIDKGVKNSK
jgi:hypothetical protein